MFFEKSGWGMLRTGVAEHTPLHRVVLGQERN